MLYDKFYKNSSLHLLKDFEDKNYFIINYKNKLHSIFKSVS